MATENNPRPSKNERRQQAREQARIAREKEKKREKRNRFFIQGGVVLGVVAILAVVALVVFQNVKPAGPGPQNMASGGAIFGEDLQVVETPALQPGEDREAPEVDREQLPIDVTIYVDYMCPGCGNFEQTYGTMLQNYIGSGDITLQVFPITFLDGQSRGTNYSTRAANIFACTVEQQPDVAFDLHNRLLSANVQPTEGTQGLTDDELLEQAEQSGAEITDELRQCVDERSFADFFSQNTKMALEDGLLGLAEGAQMDDGKGQLQPADGPQRLSQTPTVIINGEQWISSRDGDLEEYLLKKKADLEANAPAEDAEAPQE